MNKRLEEKLAMLAFGDMSPEEVTRLEQEVVGDREAMLVLEQYRGMRSGLRAMADIPEHQLSTERLRNAVLNQGLKPKSRPQIGWLWMPTMAAALAFGFVFIRNSQNSGLPPMPMGDSFAVNKASSGNFDVQPPARNVFAMATASGEILSVQSDPQPQMVQSASYRSGSRRRVDRERVASLKQEVMEQFLNQMSVNSQPQPRTLTSDPAPIEDATDASFRVRSSETVIVIDSDKDSATGAQRAKEVDRKSNDVVVGG